MHRHSERRRDPFFDPFGGAFPRPRTNVPNHAFTDPFALFESILGDLRRHAAESDPFFGSAFPIPPPPPPLDPFSRHGPGPGFMHGSSFNPMGRTPTFPMLEPMFSQMDEPRRSHSAGHHSSTRGFFGSGGGGPRWVSESRVTRSVNGVTQSVWKRTDSDVSTTPQEYSIA